MKTTIRTLRTYWPIVAIVAILLDAANIGAQQPLRRSESRDFSNGGVIREAVKNAQHEGSECALDPSLQRLDAILVELKQINAKLTTSKPEPEFLPLPNIKANPEPKPKSNPFTTPRLGSPIRKDYYPVAAPRP